MYEHRIRREILMRWLVQQSECGLLRTGTCVAERRGDLVGIRQTVQRMDQSVFEESIRIAGQPIDQGRDRSRAATVRERFGGGELNVGCRMAKQRNERRTGLRVGGTAQRASRQRDEIRIGAGECFAQGGLRGFRFQSRERPNCVLSGNPGPGVGQRLSQRRDRSGAEADEFLGGAIAHDRTAIGQSLSQFGGREVRPRQFPPPKVFNARGSLKPDAINAAGRRTVANAASGTMVDVPTAGVHDEQ